MMSLSSAIPAVLLWAGYIALFIYLARKGKGHDTALSGNVGFGVQAFAYVATYISAVALVGFGGLAHAYGLQMLLVAAGNVWLGTWFVYRFLAWPTREWQQNLGARTPAQLIGLGHHAPMLGRALAFVFAVFLGVYASAVIKGASLLLTEVTPLPEWLLIWLVALAVGLSVCIGGLRGVLYTEAMQGMVMLAGIIMIVGAVLHKVGGPLEGVRALAQLPPDKLANNGFTALSGGEAGLFVLSLVAVTSIAVWAQPQMVQRHFAAASEKQLARTMHLAMLVLTVLVGGTYFAASLSRLFLPEVASSDAVMPKLVTMLLPDAGRHLFVLALVSASLSTATALFHIAGAALSEDVPGRKATPFSWRLAMLCCILISVGCAQIKGPLIALLHTTSWSVVASAALVPYIALVRFGKRNALAAWISAVTGFTVCLFWYLCAYAPTAVIPPLFGELGRIPPFFVAIGASFAGWSAGALVRKASYREA